MENGKWRYYYKRLPKKSENLFKWSDYKEYGDKVDKIYNDANDDKVFTTYDKNPQTQKITRDERKQRKKERDQLLSKLDNEYDAKINRQESLNKMYNEYANKENNRRAEEADQMNWLEEIEGTFLDKPSTKKLRKKLKEKHFGKSGGR